MQFLPTTPRGLSLRGGYVKRATAPISTTDQTKISQFTNSENGNEMTITGNKVIFYSYKEGEDPSTMEGRQHDSLLMKATDLKSLTVIADTVVIERDLVLPGCNVTIYARVLKIDTSGDPKAGISTQPKDHEEDAADSYIDAQDSYKVKPAKDGVQGHPGGNISLFVRTLDCDPDQRNQLFSTAGGKGQGPGGGVRGQNGTISYGWSTHEKRHSDDASDEDGAAENIWNILRGSYDEEKTGTNDVARLQAMAADPSYTIIEMKFIDPVIDEKTRKTGLAGSVEPVWIASPQPSPAIAPFSAAGVPGRGGNAGQFCSWFGLFELDSAKQPNPGTINVLAGPNGDPKNTAGGKAGWAFRPIHANEFDLDKQAPTSPGKFPPRTEARKYTFTKDWNGSILENSLVKDWDTYESVYWDDADGLEGPENSEHGTDGKITTSDRSAGWFHKDHLGIYRGYLDQVFLSNTRNSMSTWITDLQFAIAPMMLNKVPLTKAGDGPEADDEHVANLRAFARYLSGISGKLSAHQDAYGHRAGWAPATSLATEMGNYDDSVKHALQAAFAAAFLTI